MHQYSSRKFAGRERRGEGPRAAKAGRAKACLETAKPTEGSHGAVTATIELRLPVASELERARVRREGEKQKEGRKGEKEKEKEKKMHQVTRLATEG